MCLFYEIFFNNLINVLISQGLKDNSSLGWVVPLVPIFRGGATDFATLPSHQSSRVLGSQPLWEPVLFLLSVAIPLLLPAYLPG